MYFNNVFQLLVFQLLYNTDSGSHMSSGSEFQTVRPATEKARPPLHALLMLYRPIQRSVVVNSACFYVYYCFMFFLKLKIRKHLVYAGIVIMWIILPVFLSVVSFMTTDIIIGGTCIPWGVDRTQGATKAMISSAFLVTYLLPLIMMVFCYSRIVYALKHKVTITF